MNIVEEQLKSRLNKYKSVDFTFIIRAYLLNLPRSKLGIVVDVTENLVLHEEISARTLLLVKDLVAYRLRCKVMQNKTNLDRESCDRQYMNVTFHDKGMDMVDLPRILNSKKVGAAIPNYLKGPPPIVSYTYTRTIGGKIFNNRRTVEELDVENGTEGMQCSCSSSEYKYDLCGHVLTGDLSIIRDVKLRNLIRKGPVFREQNNIDWEVNLKNCKASVSKYVKKWARIASVDRQVLRDWEETVHECIEQRVRCLKQQHVNRRKKHVLKNRVHLDYLNKLHENYVLVPADKAGNNIIVVCKKYYLDVVLKELESTNTYQEVHSDCSNVVSRHLKYMVQNNIFVQEQQEHLPSFYWLPKLHKNPYGARFSAASNKCTTKQLSSLLTSCFKTILIHYKQYCSGIYKNTGVNCFWIIDNSMEVLDRLRNINRTSRAKSFDSYDFSTLYTNIPHEALKTNIRNLITEAFKVRGSKYLIVSRDGKAHWSLQPSLWSACVSVDNSKLVEWTNYLIDNVYIKVGSKVYRQTVGIPMGTDCAPQLANLFLFHYEYSYMKNLMKKNLCVAKKFNDTIRYIDDLLTVNNSKFEKEICNIYPPELTLKRTSESERNVSYLDISISICGGKYVTEVYDKRDDFNFDIVNFPYMCSNIPAKPTYGVYISQLIRICRICDNYSSFLSRHKLLTERLVRQGFWYNKLCITFKKFARRYNVLISKYGVSIRAHVTEEICIPLVAKPDLIRNVTIRGCGRSRPT